MYVPGLDNITSSPYLYNLTSVTQPGLSNQTFQVPSGKAVGGGTIVNYMFFGRGSAADYDAWEELGNPGWGWNDLLPYFKKSETFTPAGDDLADRYDIRWDTDVHGRDGPVQVSYPVFVYPEVRNFVDAWHGLGVLTPHDPAAGTARGVFTSPNSLDPKDETRFSSRRAHYDRVIEQRPNYHLLAETAVSRILLEGRRAVGVEMISSDPNNTSVTAVHAKREVILSAGVHSAQLLQLSGIGNATLMRKHGINTTIELPGVGQNFQDHPVLLEIVNCKALLSTLTFQ